MCCRKAGTVSVPGVYVGLGDKIPLGAAMNKGLTIKSGQTHVQAYTKPLLKRIEAGEIDPSFVVTHPASLEDAPSMYKKFRDKQDGVIKVVLRPGHSVLELAQLLCLVNRRLSWARPIKCRIRIRIRSF
jgi:threonine dehydrogenase-like Zn-dependent dehydrogenase